MKLKNKNILIIGGAGFIGRYIVEELLKTKVSKIVIYDNFSRGKRENLSLSLEDPRCSIYNKGGDIRDVDLLNDAMSDIDAVFHLAGMWLLHCYDYPRAAFHVNIEGTFNVLEACKNNKIEKLIYSSSASVYGDAVEEPMKEDHPFNNRNFYGATKIAGEAMCRAFHERYGLDYIGLRYMNVYGPFQDQKSVYTGVIPVMLNKIKEGKALSIDGDGKQAFDFINVKDVARANINALKSDKTDQFYNIGTGKKTSINELIKILIDLTEYKGQIIYNKERKISLVKNRVGDISKAEEELDFVYQISLDKGLSELYRWRMKYN